MVVPPASSDPELPWDRPRAREKARVPHLVLAWSLDEPERVGECIAVEREGILGRGDARSEDPAPRLGLVRMRPGVTETTAAIQNARIARVHLHLQPQGPGEIRVRSYARAPVRINGQPIREGTLAEGDVLELHNAALFLAVSRPPRFAPPRVAGSEFPFGAADPYGLVGESEAAWALRDALAFAAKTERHVLLLGESGAGKELAAHSVHGHSSRSARTLVTRNAATLPESLVDAELFGNRKNYPNPGMPERAGLIGAAHESTLFLDEVGELPLTSQVHLLRALDKGEYQRLGDPRTSLSSFRLIAATNRSAESLKHDLLARFTHRITVPGLTERREDIPLVLLALLRRILASNGQLVNRFFERRDGETAEPRIAPALVQRLLRHPFTHHVRELDRLLWLAIGSAEDDYLGVTEAVEAELGDSASSFVAAAHITREDLARALEQHGRSPTRIAQALGVKNRFVLHRLLKKHGLAADSAGEGV